MDKILKAAVWGGKVSVCVLRTTDIVNEAIRLHKFSPVAAAAFGRAVTAAAYMCAGLKNKRDSLSVAIKGDGAGGRILVSGNAALQMRGSVDNPQADLPPNALGKLDVGGFVGKGAMTVVKDMGLKHPFTGTVELVSGEIAQDFAHYFAMSEQTPTAIALGVKIGRDLTCVGAGGIVLSPLPNCGEEDIKRAEELLVHFSDISSLFEIHTANEVFDKFFAGEKYEEFYPKYKCTCSRRYIEKVVAALGYDEAADIIKTEGKLSLHCHFCNKSYDFDKRQIDRLFKVKDETN